jgi:hypothetical protein
MTEPSVSFAGNLTDDPEVRDNHDGIARGHGRIWLISRNGHDLWSDNLGEGCLAVTQPRRRVLTDGRAAPNLEEGSPWPSCSM